MGRYGEDKVMYTKNMFKQSLFRNGEEMPEGTKSLKKSRMLFWEHVMMGLIGGYILSRYIWIPTDDARETLITSDIFMKISLFSAVLGVVFGWLVEFLYLRKSDIFDTLAEKNRYIARSAGSGVLVVVAFFLMAVLLGGYA